MWQELRNNWIFFLDDVYFAWRSAVDWYGDVKRHFTPPPPSESQRKFVLALANNVHRVK
jgi:hypothetical protein